jgi:signal peptidase I
MGGDSGADSQFMCAQAAELSRRSMTHRVATFVPASLPASDVRVALPAPVAVRYQAAVVGQPGATALSWDPTALHDLPMMRLVTNVVATFALVLFGGLAVAATAPRLLGYESVVVTSGSMEPAVHKADVLVIAPSDGTDLREGAVINFDRDGERILHRIVSVTPDGYGTAGDANNIPDSELVLPTQVHGVGFVVVPFIGLPATWAAEGRWFLLALALAALIACLFMSRARWVDSSQDPQHLVLR